MKVVKIGLNPEEDTQIVHLSSWKLSEKNEIYIKPYAAFVSHTALENNHGLSLMAWQSIASAIKCYIERFTQKDIDMDKMLFLTSVKAEMEWYSFDFQIHQTIEFIWVNGIGFFERPFGRDVKAARRAEA
jgi:hypothetical protein